jgi:chaperonin GroES
MKVQPLFDRVLIKRVEAKESVKGGIIIPDTAKEKPQEGEVIAVGEGRIDDEGKRIKPQVKKGDRVLFGKYSGSELRINDEDHLILKEDEILGIVL